MIRVAIPPVTLRRTPVGWYVLVGVRNEEPYGPYPTRGQAESKRAAILRRYRKLGDKPAYMKAGAVRLLDLLVLAAAIGLAAWVLWPT